MQASDALAETMHQLEVWHRTGVWASLTELVNLGAALKDSATPAIAERVASLAIGLGQVAGEVGPGVTETVGAVETHGAALRDMIEELAGWHQDGTWKALTEAVTVLRALSDSVTPHMVERVVEMIATLGAAINAAVESGLLDLGIRLGDALMQASRAADKDETRYTAMGLARRIKQPEVQRSVKVLMALLQQLPNAIEPQ
jgi:uncharacterized protein YjgD (DUF1641 family)